MSCPICRKTPETGHAPFCSKRCADLDLWRWLSGSYSVPCDEDLPEGFEGVGLPRDGEARQ